MISSTAQDTPATSTLVLSIHAADGQERRQEPVSCGVPWPRGVLRAPNHLRMLDADGSPTPLQARVLDSWPDGSVRWVLLDWQANVNGATTYQVNIAPESKPSDPVHASLKVRARETAVTVDTGVTEFLLQTGGEFPFHSVRIGAVAAIDAGRSRLVVEDQSGAVFEPRLTSLRLEESGPVRAVVYCEGDLVSKNAPPLGRLMARLHFFAGSPVVRFVLTLRNPRRAAHPGGLWDLGDGGSILVRDAALTFALPPGNGPSSVRCSPQMNAPFESFAPPVEVYQDSSGGPNWQSTNHRNRRHVVPNSFCGYRLRAGGREQVDKRATPVVVLQRGEQALAVAMPHFWQAFPKALEATNDAVVLRLFPHQYADVHEIQGGEQKTHEFYVAFGPDQVTTAPLDWCRTPLAPHAAPEWYCSTQAIPYLTPKDDDPNTTYLRLVDAAMEGDDTFARKREVVDEYGWRHFGEIYGDHEAVRHQGSMPLVSHYNNQYDPLAGFAYQFLRSGDPRWRGHMVELAAHVSDIDIYHTEEDKAAYNHGLFWHTVHYVDADTGTHRSYPRASKVCGGGPSCEQNYTAGLLLHYFLTGDPLSRATALDLAQWVIDMDDGRKTVFRWLDRGFTGLASNTGSPRYHGPGRGAGNSLNALVDAHRLTGEERFLAKAEQLLRRCIHPADDIAAHHLLDAERKWFYTVFLQALGRYLDYQAERGDLGFMYAYARASLVHYARWMAQHEYPYLDQPAFLEFPTETWAAQDMRKSEVFKYAAKHATEAERTHFLERSEFFFRYSTETLSGMKTRTLARPVVLMLCYGFMHSYFQRYPDTALPSPAEAHDFGRPAVFVPQKARAKKRLAQLIAAGAGVAALGFIYWLC